MTLAGTERRRRQLITAGLGTALTLVMGTVLIMGFRLATHMRANIGALQTASTLQIYPQEISHQLNSLRDRLEVRAYSGQALADLQGTVKRFDQKLNELSVSGEADAPQLHRALQLWHQYAPVLDPVLSFNAQPYVDSDTAGSSLSREGRQYYAEVKRAQLFASDSAGALQGQLAALAATLQRTCSDAAARLRMLLLAGVLAALALAGAAGYFRLTRSSHERAAREAQEQTRDILKTVHEGFFLLDADYRIGSVWSEALTRMFGRQDFAGLSFEELLKDLVAPATLATATKYIKLLWGDRAHENLMKSINPLGQLEIVMDNGHGGKETRYLEFDFHRVMGPEGVKHVLCAVGDITSSVRLAHELRESQKNANAQVDMMLSMLHVEPLQLMDDLDSTETSLNLVNGILREPARSDAEFRKKLGGLFRELHGIKGEASALNLKSVASRVHVLEDMVADCKRKRELSGSDFLPLVLKLDDLLAHLRSVREMGARLTTLKESGPAAAASVAAAAPHGSAAPRQPRPVEELSSALQSMAERLAEDHAKRFRLTVSGLSEVPPSYAATIKDCVIQMLRNAAVHGIEPPEVRRAHTKHDVGAVSVHFRKVGEGYELVFEEEARSMDTRAAMALIFRPGFSTQDDVSMDAGRGVGMDVVARSVYALGGRIGVSTHPGRFTRFKILLPAAQAVSSAVA